MYAFTAVDPDFKPKGSRDPLGFQPIWSEVGRKLIKDLSTVSANINDFRILCITKYYFQEVLKEDDERKFLLFFLRAEQAFAYARRKWNNEISFNGGDFISKHFTDTTYHISNDQKDCILSNQRTYGIYGKYIRPSRDMKLFDNENFASVYQMQFNSEIKSLFEKIFNQQKIVFKPEELNPLAAFLKKFTGMERDFFRNNILIGNKPGHNQVKLYDFLLKNPEWADTSKFNILNWIDGAQRKIDDEPLKQTLINIQNTEKVLAPLSYRFIYLLTRGTWTEESIQKDEILTQKINQVPFDFKSDQLNELNNILPLTGVQLVDKLIERNAATSKRRNGNPWIDKRNQKYVVYYGETNRDFTPIDQDYWENPYFIQSYIRLFNSIQK